MPTTNLGSSTQEPKKVLKTVQFNQAQEPSAETARSEIQESESSIETAPSYLSTEDKNIATVDYHLNIQQDLSHNTFNRAIASIKASITFGLEKQYNDNTIKKGTAPIDLEPHIIISIHNIIQDIDGDILSVIKITQNGKTFYKFQLVSNQLIEDFFGSMDEGVWSWSIDDQSEEEESSRCLNIFKYVTIEDIIKDGLKKLCKDRDDVHCYTICDTNKIDDNKEQDLSFEFPKENAPILTDEMMRNIAYKIMRGFYLNRIPKINRDEFFLKIIDLIDLRIGKTNVPYANQEKNFLKQFSIEEQNIIKQFSKEFSKEFSKYSTNTITIINNIDPDPSRKIFNIEYSTKDYKTILSIFMPAEFIGGIKYHRCILKNIDIKTGNIVDCSVQYINELDNNFTCQLIEKPTSVDEIIDTRVNRIVFFEGSNNNLTDSLYKNEGYRANCDSIHGVSNVCSEANKRELSYLRLINGATGKKTFHYRNHKRQSVVRTDGRLIILDDYCGPYIRSFLMEDKERGVYDFYTTKKHRFDALSGEKNIVKMKWEYPNEAEELSGISKLEVIAITLNSHGSRILITHTLGAHENTYRVQYVSKSLAKRICSLSLNLASRVPLNQLRKDGFGLFAKEGEFCITIANIREKENLDNNSESSLNTDDRLSIDDFDIKINQWKDNQKNKRLNEIFEFFREKYFVGYSNEQIAFTFIAMWKPTAMRFPKEKDRAIGIEYSQQIGKKEIKCKVSALDIIPGKQFFVAQIKSKAISDFKGMVKYHIFYPCVEYNSSKYHLCMTQIIKSNEDITNWIFELVPEHLIESNTTENKIDIEKIIGSLREKGTIGFDELKIANIFPSSNTHSIKQIAKLTSLQQLEESFEEPEPYYIQELRNSFQKLLHQPSCMVNLVDKNGQVKMQELRTQTQYFDREINNSANFYNLLNKREIDERSLRRIALVVERKIVLPYSTDWEEFWDMVIDRTLYHNLHRCSVLGRTDPTPREEEILNDLSMQRAEKTKPILNDLSMQRAEKTKPLNDLKAKSTQPPSPPCPNSQPSLNADGLARPKTTIPSINQNNVEHLDPGSSGGARPKTAMRPNITSPTFNVAATANSKAEIDSHRKRIDYAVRPNTTSPTLNVAATANSKAEIDLHRKRIDDAVRPNTTSTKVKTTGTDSTSVASSKTSRPLHVESSTSGEISKHKTASTGFLASPHIAGFKVKTTGTDSSSVASSKTSRPLHVESSTSGEISKHKTASTGLLASQHIAGFKVKTTGTDSSSVASSKTFRSLHAESSTSGRIREHKTASTGLLASQHIAGFKVKTTGTDSSSVASSKTFRPPHAESSTSVELSTSGGISKHKTSANFDGTLNARPKTAFAGDDSRSLPSTKGTSTTLPSMLNK